MTPEVTVKLRCRRPQVADPPRAVCVDFHLPAPPPPPGPCIPLLPQGALTMHLAPRVHLHSPRGRCPPLYSGSGLSQGSSLLDSLLRFCHLLCNVFFIFVDDSVRIQYYRLNQSDQRPHVNQTGRNEVVFPGNPSLRPFIPKAPLSGDISLLSVGNQINCSAGGGHKFQ